MIIDNDIIRAGERIPADYYPACSLAFARSRASEADCLFAREALSTSVDEAREMCQDLKARGTLDATALLFLAIREAQDAYERREFGTAGESLYGAVAVIMHMIARLEKEAKGLSVCAH